MRYEPLRGRLADRADIAPAAYRIGIGLTITLAGAHKLVDPGAWSAYTAPAIAVLWPLPLGPTMVANGLLELPFGVAILLDRYTTLAAAVVAASLAGVLVNLALYALTTGLGVDVLIRDLGLFFLAAGTMLQSADG